VIKFPWAQEPIPKRTVPSEQKMHKAILICTSMAMFFAQSILAEPAKKGPVTNLPMPRYVSLKAGEANARRGPSLSHKIDWVYKRRGVPLEIYAEYENWRRVRDYEGAGGWIHYSLLSGVRTVLITQDLTNVFRKPDENAIVVARFEKNVVADLGTCTKIWCEVEAGGYKGWAQKFALWGVYPSETRE
jgi:SH3-like domain-containing protein